MRVFAAFAALVACGSPGTPTASPNAPHAASASATSYTPPAPMSSVAAPIAGPSATPTQIAAGGEVTCARMSDGCVRCWGKNQFGQVGEGAADEQKRPRAIPGLSGVAQIAVPSGVVCWGTNSAGQLGDGTTTNRVGAVAVQF
jgi:alpha-tubulin suppressor-like RCC1 family protein